MINKYQSRIKNHVVSPIQYFMNQEKSGGIVLAISVIIALVLANSPLKDEYMSFLHYKLGFIFNGTPFLNFTLEHWINDGLMSMFFFVVGLELKREFIGGELREIKKVTLPVAAAIFGMLFPAAIYLIMNAGTPVVNGWGIPMATDIAFALAVIYLLGNRVPTTIKVFLTTLAIVDDLGSVLVIALFYTSEISFASIGLGFLFLTIMMIANKMGVKNVVFYGLLGIGGVWIAFLMSGVHATIAAVLAAFMIPADAIISEEVFLRRMKRKAKQFEEADTNDVSTLEPQQVEILSQMEDDSRDAVPPLQRLEHSMHPLVAFVIMPIFAFGNAGICFLDMDIKVLFSTNVALGVMLGLLAGKPLGIVCAVWLVEKLGLGKRSEDTTWKHFIGIGFLASIGFTMSMFVTMLAFKDPTYHMQAKVGIFAASILGGIIGYQLLKKKSITQNTSGPQK